MYEIIKADEAKFDVRKQIAEIFADGFIKWLEYFSKDKKVIAKAFAHMFILSEFYIAVEGNEVLGMVSCNDCKKMSIKLNGRELRKHLGLIKGIIAKMILKKEFEAPFKNPKKNTGSIEYVGTSSKYLGKGVASSIIKYIFDNTPYNEYLIEEVADTNIPAMRLYKKMGFVEYKYKEIPIKEAKKININRLVSLKYIKKKLL